MYQRVATLLATLLVLALYGCGEPEPPSTPQKPVPLTPGARIGEFRRTMYILAYEKDFRGRGAMAYGKNGEKLGRFSADFLEDISLQGSGLSKDGLVLGLEYKGCKGRQFFSSWGPKCFRIMDPQQFPMGVTTKGTSPRAFRTVAVDRSQIPLGSRLYLPNWDGYELPNGTVHDGCFVAEDTGVAITWGRLDVHVGLGRRVYQKVLQDLGGVAMETVFYEHSRCRGALKVLVGLDHYLNKYEGKAGGIPAKTGCQNKVAGWTCEDSRYPDCYEGISYACYNASKPNPSVMTPENTEMCYTSAAPAGFPYQSMRGRCRSPLKLPFSCALHH